MAWRRYPDADWPPDDWLARDPSPWWGWKVVRFLLVFLVGGAAGYLARDLEGKPQVTQITEDVRQDLERTARSVAGAVRNGMRAAAESAKGALTVPATADSAAPSGGW